MLIQVFQDLAQIESHRNHNYHRTPQPITTRPHASPLPHQKRVRQHFPHRLAPRLRPSPATMSDETTSTPAPTHEPPSLPNSPLPKRTKVIDPTPFSSTNTLPRGTDSGAATPTPLANTYHPHHMASSAPALQPPAQIAPSVAAAAAAEQQLQVLLLSEHAKAPTKGSVFAAGHDLYSARDITIPARGRALVPTDISISVPVGTCGFTMRDC